MGIFGSVVQTLMGSMLDVRQSLPLRYGIGAGAAALLMEEAL